MDIIYVQNFKIKLNLIRQIKELLNNYYARFIKYLYFLYLENGINFNLFLKFLCLQYFLLSDLHILITTCASNSTLQRL